MRVDAFIEFQDKTLLNLRQFPVPTYSQSMRPSGITCETGAYWFTARYFGLEIRYFIFQVSYQTLNTPPSLNRALLASFQTLAIFPSFPKSVKIFTSPCPFRQTFFSQIFSKPLSGSAPRSRCRRICTTLFGKVNVDPALTHAKPRSQNHVQRYAHVCLYE